jgi:hypothetical protein
MKFVANFFAWAVLAAGIAGFSTTDALAAKGQDFPGTKCTCQKCATGGGDLTGDCSSVCKDKTVYSAGSEPHDYCKSAARTVTGNDIRAAMGLIGLKAVALARAAKVSPATISSMEAAENKPVHADAATIDKVIHALQLKGVEITEDGVRLVQKPAPMSKVE